MNDPTVQLTPNSPRLTTDAKSKGFEHPLQCGNCGRRRESLPVGKGLLRWQEHDHCDKPEPRVVVLCPACSDKLIKPHVRLYRHLHGNDPWAGCMTLCVDCRWRLGVGCTHPRARANGGPGVQVTAGEIINAFVDGPSFRGRLSFYKDPPSACAQHESV